MIKNNDFCRKIILDIETTGMNFSGPFYKGHKIIEIGAVELFNRNLTGKNFHVYINPDRIIDDKAFKIHGIADNFLKDKPKFSDIFIDFLKFIKNSEIIIHNAKFDIGFLNYELNNLKLNIQSVNEICKITDTLKIARNMFPGKKNSLDALCSRLDISIRERFLHSAILDAQLLAKVYLILTSIQKKILFKEDLNNNNYKDYVYFNSEIFLKKANLKEKNLHESYIKKIRKKTGFCLWKNK
ncbi:DNA polymerase III subunit epsilon [Buchnera aphidicola (Mollitrichosiphum nigrofasciatum)]|uniref:DNA polymerase III subunit epsilon n=1 Tax=Buchnera aphidicola TaxID=9 RepID=UPI0031B89BCB